MSFFRRTLFCWPATTIDSGLDLPGVDQSGNPDQLGEFGYVRPAIVRTEAGGLLVSETAGQSFIDRQFKGDWIVFDSPSDGNALVELIDKNGAVIGTMTARPGSHFAGPIAGVRVVAIQKLAGPAVCAYLIGSGVMPAVSSSLDWAQPVTIRNQRNIDDADFQFYTIDYPATSRPAGGPSTYAFALGAIPSPARITSLTGYAVCGATATQFQIIGKIAAADPGPPPSIQPLIGANGTSGTFTLPSGWFEVARSTALANVSLTAYFDSNQVGPLNCPVGAPGTNLYLYLLARANVPTSTLTTAAAATAISFTVMDH